MVALGVSMFPVKGVLFDLYDTLAFLDPAIYLANKRRMAEIVGVSADDFLEAWKRHGTLSARGAITVAERVTLTLRSLGVEPLPDLVAQIISMEQNLQDTKVVLFESTKPTLAALRSRGLKLGLVSNVSSTAIRLPYRLSIAAYLDTIVASCEVGVVKPDPEIYLIACKNLELSPKECLYVGDGNDRELDGAHAIGMRTVLIEQIRNEPLRTQQSSYFDHKISDLKELLAIV